MCGFLITSRIYGKLKLFSALMLRLYFVETIPALATQKRVNKAIHPQYPTKYAREAKHFLPVVFQMIPPLRVKTYAWNILLAGEFLILMPSVTVSRFAATHICIFKNFTLYSNTVGEWVQTSLVILTKAPRPVVFNPFCTATHCNNPL